MLGRFEAVLDWLGGLSLPASVLLSGSGLAIVAAAPALVGLLLARPPPDPRDSADPGQVSIPAFALSNPEGRRIGALEVDYPRSMRENESRPITLRYRAAGNWRGVFASHPELRIEATVSGARLDVVPGPARHVFRNALIARRGADSRAWEVVPRAEGDYMLQLRLEVTPETFSVGPIAANGEVRAAGDDQRLPVRVYTRYSVPQTTVDLASIATAFIGFLVTLAGLPGLLRMLRTLLGLAPEPAAAASRRKRARRGRR